MVGASVDGYDAGMITEGSGSYTSGASNTATRMVLSPRETPQSVTVITREQMEDFDLNSVAEVMQRTPLLVDKDMDMAGCIDAAARRLKASRPTRASNMSSCASYGI